MDQSGEVNQDESGSEDSDLEIANKGLKFNEWEVKILEAVIFFATGEISAAGASGGGKNLVIFVR